MSIVWSPRRQRGGRMHYSRRRLQKGEGILGDALKFWSFCYRGHGSVKKAKNNDVTMSRMVWIKRQVPFLQSLVRRAKFKQRDALLRAANAEQINAVSEMVLNVLTNDQFPVRPDLVARLRPHKKALPELRKKKNSVKRRREILLK